MHEGERLVRALDEAARTKNYEAMRALLAPNVKAQSPSYDLDSADALIEAIQTQNDVVAEISTELTVDVVGNKVFWESVWTGT